MFYDVFLRLCASKNVSPSKAAEAIGLNRAAVAKWKNGATPSAVTAIKLADYFGVTTDYLLGKPDQKEIPPAKPEGQEPSGQKTLSTEEKQHIKKYRLLNEAGKEKTDEYMEILLGNEDFKKGEKVLEVVARSGDHLQVSDNGALDDMVISYPDDL